ncbi:reverse transcriptase protein [Rutstroemia sp. NJR-2017a BBW]|nr:reverse transcriptase protein [Rutstroemia sp. NJR-2017a BBW]
MATLLRDPKIQEYDILALQEPWRNPFTSTTHNPISHSFHLCFPKDSKEAPARLEVHRIYPRSYYTRYYHTNSKYKRDIEDCNTQCVQPSEVLRPPALSAYYGEEQIILGDFNLHHELWGGRTIQTRDPESDNLIDLVEEFQLGTLLPAGTITYDDKNAQSCIDLCYGTQDIVDRIIICNTDPSIDHNSDHLPITTILDLRTIQRQVVHTYDWSNIDEKEFRIRLEYELPILRCPKTKTALDRYVREVVAAIETAIKHSTPLKRWSPRARAGWTAECKEIQLEARRLKRQNSREHTEESWEAYRTARNRKGRVIRRALLQGHREQVERAMQSPESMWKLAKWARNREGATATTTPALKDPITNTEYAEAQDKARLLKTTKYLGVTLDTALNWKHHIQNVTTKISKSIGALTSLAGSTWGASVTELRRIYQAVVIPQMMYGCSVWSVAQERGEGYTKQTANSLKRLQAKAARIIGGAYKAISGAALDIELHLLPIEQQIWKTNAETVSRILSTDKMPTLAGFRTLRNTRNRGRQTLYVSPLEHIY